MATHKSGDTFTKDGEMFMLVAKDPQSLMWLCQKRGDTGKHVHRFSETQIDRAEMIAPPRTSLAECKVGERVSVTELRVGDRVGGWDGHLAHWPAMTVVMVSDNWVSLVGDGEHRDWKAGIDPLSSCTCLRLPAQPAAIVPAAQMELRRDDLRAGDEYDFGYSTGNRYRCTGPNRGVDVMHPDEEAMIAVANCRVHNVVRAPTTTPPSPCKVAPSEATYDVLRCYAAQQQGGEGAVHVADTDLAAARNAWSAAVSLRLAARAEAKRLSTQIACEPSVARDGEFDE